MSIAFRIAGPGDVPELLALVEGAYRGDSARRGWSHEADLLDGQRTDAEGLSDIIGDPAQTILLARSDEGLVGCVQLKNLGGRLAYLGLLSVDPMLQAAGLGRALLAEAERFAREQLDADRIEMTVIRHRSELIAWYERRGYALTGATAPFPMDDPRFGLPKRDDLAFVVLEKRLEAEA